MPCDFLSLSVEEKGKDLVHRDSFFSNDVVLSLTLISEQPSEEAYLIGCLYYTAHRRQPNSDLPIASSSIDHRFLSAFESRLLSVGIAVI